MLKTKARMMPLSIDDDAESDVQTSSPEIARSSASASQLFSLDADDGSQNHKGGFYDDHLSEANLQSPSLDQHMDARHGLPRSVEVDGPQENFINGSGYGCYRDRQPSWVHSYPAFADMQASSSVVFYAIRNILRPSFILGQIPDLLDLLAMVDTFRRHAVEVSSAALSWHEYYTKEPSPDMRLLTKYELKKLQGYIAKDEHDRLLYTLHVYHLMTAPE